MRFLRLAGAAALGVCLTGGAPAGADSHTDVIPAEAKAVVVVNNIDKFVKDSEKFTTAIGQPAPGNDLGQITQVFGEIGQRWKLDRGIAFAVMQPAGDGVAVVFPVDDGAAALKGMMPEMKGDLGKFDLVGQSAVGLASGKNVIVGMGESTVSSFKGFSKSMSQTLSAAQQKLAKESAVYARVDVQAFKPMIEQGLENNDFLKKICEKIAEKSPGMNVEQMTQTAEKLLKAACEHAQAIYITHDVSEQAFHLRIGVELLANSPLRQKLAEYKPSGAGLFGSLPSTNFIAAIGADVQALSSMSKNAGMKIDGFGAALSFDDGLLSFMSKLDTADPNELNEGLKGVLALGGMMAAGQSQGMVEFVAGESTVGGAKVGQATVKFKDLQPKGREVMSTVFGGTDIVLQHGVVGKSMGLTISGKADSFAAVQKTGSLSQEARVQTTAKLMPKNTFFAVMVDPMTALYTAKAIAAKIKPEEAIAKANVPAKAGAPLGLGMTVENDGGALHLMVPAASLKDVVPLLQSLQNQ